MGVNSVGVTSYNLGLLRKPKRCHCELRSITKYLKSDCIQNTLEKIRCNIAILYCSPLLISPQRFEVNKGFLEKIPSFWCQQWWIEWLLPSLGSNHSIKFWKEAKTRLNILLLSSAFVFVSSSSHNAFFLPDTAHFGVRGWITVIWNISTWHFSSFSNLKWRTIIWTKT